MAHLAVRVNLRLDAAEKASIDRAAELLGVHTSTFARQAVLRETERVLAADSAVELGPQESRRFLAALDEPFKADERLPDAVEDALRLSR